VGLLMMFGPLALASLFHWHKQDGTEPWIIHFLWFFFLGMITWWTLDRTLSPLVYTTFIAVAFVQLAFDWRFPNAIAATTAVAIFTAGRMGRLHVWLDWPWLQYLGKISYSLYLVHYSVIHLLMSVGWKWCDNSPTSLQAAAILLTSLGASIAAAHVLYLVVEAPTGHWAARLKRRTAAAAS
jgi:peptidoglycan/LPS O-acetylase OafA/YrhL